MRIQLLNHAAVVIETCDVRILCDPWFAGTCFADGWGLQFDNPAALEACRDCTHLWVSHFHGDHFHVPTLKRVLEVNPRITALGNRSFNFQMDDALRHLGFAEVVSLKERRAHALTEAVSVTRYPTTGIDNMLLVRSDEGSLLNYNDCNLPRGARQSIARKIGPVDVLLNNFNHAGKFVEFPEKPADQIKQDMKDNFLSNCESFEARWIIPFASYHYYRAPETQSQNQSLLSLQEIAAVCPNVVPLAIGQSVSIAVDRFDVHGQAVGRHAEPTTIVREGHASLDQIRQAFGRFKRRVNFSFGGLTWLLPELRVYMPDIERTIAVSLRRGVVDRGVVDRGVVDRGVVDRGVVDRGVVDRGTDQRAPHISAHSSCLLRWFSDEYGTDGFWVGGHFDLCSEKLLPLRWQLLVSLMTENRVDLWSLLKAGLTPRGWSFLWCRREEIWGILVGRRFTVGSRD